MMDVFGEDRRVCLAKELTKSFETILNDNLPALINYLESDSNHQKGEFVILVSPADKIELDEANVELEKILPILCEEMGASKAAKLASKITGLDKKYCYKKAIIL
jgi:16S rRNA (cytidine1402-2'-O)-methyltransferase